MLSVRTSTNQSKKYLNTLKRCFVKAPLATDHYIQPAVKRFSKPVAFEELFGISQKANSIYFAQGFPDWDTPRFVRMAMIEAVQQEENQYIRPAGHPELCREIAEKYSKIYNREINAMSQILVSNGATAILTNAMGPLMSPGEHEIVCFAPAFLGYIPLFHIMGAKNVRWVYTYNNPDGSIGFNKEEFEAAFNSKTRFFVFNNPGNPSGKVFTKNEMNYFRSVMLKYPNVIALCDDVYEHQIYDNNVMHRFANLPDMWDRTINVFSAGKTFSNTGWRVGYAIGPEHLIKAMTVYSTWANYCGSRPAQAAVASCMAQAKNSYKNHETFYDWCNWRFEMKRDRLCEIIGGSDIGMNVYEPEGGYFMVAGIKDAIRKMPIKYFYRGG